MTYIERFVSAVPAAKFDGQRMVYGGFTPILDA